VGIDVVMSVGLVVKAVKGLSRNRSEESGILGYMCLRWRWSYVRVGCLDVYGNGCLGLRVCGSVCIM